MISTGNSAEKSATMSNEDGVHDSESVVNLLPHHVFEIRDGARGEDVADQLAHLLVLGGVHRDDHFGHGMACSCALTMSRVAPLAEE